MQRIEEFLNEPEVPDWASSLQDPASAETRPDEIGFVNGTFEWDIAPRSEPSRFTLGPLNVKFPKGKLSLVSGPTGSGKSALLNALLGGRSCSNHSSLRKLTSSPTEMSCTTGQVLFNKAGHQVAYCAQNPCKHGLLLRR